MRDAGCEMRDAGCGCEMQDAGCVMRDAGCGMRDADARMRDASSPQRKLWVQNCMAMIQPAAKRRAQDPAGFDRISDFRFEISD